jgi:hypothetical protein
MKGATNGRMILGYCLIFWAPMKPSIAKSCVAFSHSAFLASSLPPNILLDARATIHVSLSANGTSVHFKQHVSVSHIYAHVHTDRIAAHIDFVIKGIDDFLSDGLQY